MSKTQHPDMEQLIGYVDAPQGGSDRTVALHLARCNECRVHVSNFMRLQQRVKSLAALKTTSSDGVLRAEDERAIVGNHLSNEHITYLKNDKQRLRAALYLSSQVNAINTVNSVKSNTSPPTSPQIKRFTHWWEKLMNFMPQWEYAALAASLTLAVVFGIHLMQQEKQVNIVAYSDNPVVVFKQVKSNTPGIGFFSGAVNTSKAYSGVSVSALGNNKWMLQWPDISNAENYLLQLYRVANGNTELLFEKRSMNTRLTISDLALSDHTRYEWKLSGNTSDQRRFSASGGFILQ